MVVPVLTLALARVSDMDDGLLMMGGVPFSTFMVAEMEAA
jgi:hypothetical protein